ncbi:MAG: alkaline phosphatase family protein [Candidatus Thorarchaeota archaeon]
MKLKTKRAPLIVRIIAGIDIIIMILFVLVGINRFIDTHAFFGLLASLQVTDPTAYAAVVLFLSLVGLTVPMFAFGLYLTGAITIIVSIIGIILAYGTATKKTWAVPLGVGVSIIAIIGGIISYGLNFLAPFEALGPIIILLDSLSLLFGILAVNVFFVGAFMIWQLNEQPYQTMHIGRFILVWNLNAICLLVTAIFYNGIVVEGLLTDNLLAALGTVYIAVAVIAVLNVVIRPIFIKIASLVARWWLGFAISFVLMFLINGIIFMLLSIFMPGFFVINIAAAILAGLIVAAFNAIVVNIVGLDDDSGYFTHYIARQIQKDIKAEEIPQTPGVVALEIDGLSYPVLQEALKREYMPTIQYLIDQGSHELKGYDCGIPSMTSSCQAGIMYGNNEDIPAFRWYIKSEDRMMTSNKHRDAKFIDTRASDGTGILRKGGASISNLTSGDASYSFFTMATLTDKDLESGKRRSKDIYYYLLNPYAMNRSVLYTIWDILVEIGQIIKQTITRRKPRMNRFHKFYPGTRAATNIFMRDISTAMVIQNITRGVPGIYTTFLGYDEIAHHSGPMTTDALKALKGLDKQIRRVLHAINHIAPRPYHLFILSDHGQSCGWTFKQRYDTSIKDLIANLLEGKLSVGEIEAIDAHVGYVGGLVEDLNTGQEEVEGKKGKNALRHFYRQKSETEDIVGEADVTEDNVIVCASGNLAQIYFKTQKERLTLQDFEQQFPGFISKLVAHEGVGFALIKDANRGPIALGKEGVVELRTGKIEGTNPLTPYDKPNVRIKQLLRLAEFPSAGDITLISPVYPDGSVAAYEELIGNHGGVGGYQTHAILLHPTEIKVDSDKITNSEEIYHILNQGRSET